VAAAPANCTNLRREISGIFMWISRSSGRIADGGFQGKLLR